MARCTCPTSTAPSTSRSGLRDGRRRALQLRLRLACGCGGHPAAAASLRHCCPAARWQIGEGPCLRRARSRCRGRWMGAWHLSSCSRPLRACQGRRAPFRRRRGAIQRTTRNYDTRVQSKIHSLASLAAARATCQPAAAARRSQARRGAHPCTQNAGVHPRPRLRPAHTAACPRAYAGGGPWWRISAFGLRWRAGGRG